MKSLVTKLICQDCPCRSLSSSSKSSSLDPGIPLLALRECLTEGNLETSDGLSVDALSSLDVCQASLSLEIDRWLNGLVAAWNERRRAGRDEVELWKGLVRPTMWRNWARAGVGASDSDDESVRGLTGRRGICEDEDETEDTAASESELSKLTRPGRESTGEITISDALDTKASESVLSSMRSECMKLSELELSMRELRGRDWSDSDESYLLWKGL